MVGIKERVNGFQKGIWNVISSSYNIGYNPDLSIGKSAVRKIQCSYTICIEQFDWPWDINAIGSNLKWYSVNKIFYWIIFNSLKVWNIIILTTTNISNDTNDGAIFETILKGVDSKKSKRIISYIYTYIYIYSAMRTMIKI